MLHKEAPAIALRELLEAVLGLKCSRVDVSRAGLERLEALACELGFGIAVADCKTLPAVEPGKGDWSDHAIKYVPLDHPEGLYTVYLATTPEDAETARLAEAYMGDAAFGELLLIPECCRRFYLDRRPNALAAGDDYIWETLGGALPGRVEPAGANIVAQYFGRCLLSHFPCSLSCAASRQASAFRRGVLSQVSIEFSDYLAEAHGWSMLILRGRGMIAYPEATVTGGGDVIPGNVAPPSIGEIPSEIAQAERLFTDAKGHVVAEREGGRLRLHNTEARLVAVGTQW
jgi:hypothetical protein